MKRLKLGSRSDPMQMTKRQPQAVVVIEQTPVHAPRAEAVRAEAARVVAARFEAARTEATRAEAARTEAAEAEAPGQPRGHVSQRSSPQHPFHRQDQNRTGANLRGQ